MVYELKQTPFYKPQVLAMLNTLFPPIVKELPNDRIQPKVLHQYRSSFYRYMTAVEANGPSVMDAFERKLQMDGNRHSWKATWENLRSYTELAESMMKQADVAIKLGIDAFAKGNYTKISPLALLDRALGPQSHEPSDILTESLTPLLREMANSSFEGPRAMGAMRILSSVVPFRSHSRSRAKANKTTNTKSTVPPSIPKDETFSSTTSTVVNTPGITPSSSFDATTTTSFSSTASDARQSIYAAHGIPLSAQSKVPPLPKLDTDSIRRRHHTVSRPTAPFSDRVSTATQYDASRNTFILEDGEKRYYVRRRSADMAPVNIPPSTSAGEKKTSRTGNESEKDLLETRREKLFKEKGSIFDLRPPSTSHGEKAPKGKDTNTKTTGNAKGQKTLKEKKSMVDLRRPSTPHGETSRERNQPLKQQFMGPERRPRTSYGEKTFGGQQTEKGDLPFPNSARSMQSPLPIAKELKSSLKSPRHRPLPAPPSRASTFPPDGTQRPRTSHGERGSQPISSGTTVVRDFGYADRRIGKSPLSARVQFEDDFSEQSSTTMVATMKADHQTTPRGEQTLGGKEKRVSQLVQKQEVPAPLAEVKSERTPSFYYSHMDSPSMPPPLSLGPKKQDFAPEVREKPLPSPAASASSRKPVPSSIPVPSGRIADPEISDKPPSSSLGRRMFARKPIPAFDSNPKSPLPSDGLAFLSRPYEDMPVFTPPPPKKKPSLTSLFQREHKPAKVEEAQLEPEMSGKSDASKKPVSILKRSKSMQSLPKTELGDTQTPPVLRSKRSIGESLRARFNIKAEEVANSDGQPPKKKDNKPKPKPIQAPTYRPGDLRYQFNNDQTEAAKIQRGEIELEIDGWKPSYMTKDQSVPRTPRGLDEPHFEEQPEYTPGTVALPQREMIPQRKEDARRIAAQGGKYGQGPYVMGGDGYPELEGSLMPELKKQVHIKAEHEKTSRERLIEKMAKEQGSELDEKVRMKPVLKTTTDERLGPMIEEIRMIVGAAKKESFVVVEGNGEEDRPSPTDRGDEKSYFDDEPGTPRRLRGSKSTGDLRNSNRNKLVKKKSVEEVGGGSGTKTASISAPRPVVSLPEWDEKLETNLSKEYTRKHLMEKAKAEKKQWYLNPPSGNSVDRKLPKKKMRALSRIHKLESVKEESNLTIRGLPSNTSKEEYSSSDSDATIMPEKPQPKPIVKKVRILSQATREYDHEFEQPRATPKPPRVPDGRKMRDDALLWTAEERERFREKEMERQKRGTLRLFFKGIVEENDEDWG